VALGFAGKATGSSSQSKGLTFAERVAYQRAIEEVYWRHRIWPESADPKPSLNDVMSQAQLEGQVADYLGKSQAVQDKRHQPISAMELQAEMDRMAKYTKQPEVLHELFEALGNDPFVIAECLARPVLSERLLAHSAGELVKQTSQTYKEVVAATGHYSLPEIAGGSGCTDDTWTAITTANAPSARYYHTAIWTGSEMIVWGGANATGVFNTGRRYNPTTDTWTGISTTNAPSARAIHTAVWTGTEMIVWGGENTSPFYLNTGGRYNPGTDSWTHTSTTNAPSTRYGHTALWTGSEMVIWGGHDFSGRSNTGGRYNPSMDSWTVTSTTNAPAGREHHTAVWTGSEMIVWGGASDTGYLRTGGRYNPTTNGWTGISTNNAPSARANHTAVWTGSRMIIWGGDNSGHYFNTGGRYNPSTNSWIATSTTNAPARRYVHTAVWTGSEAIVWGGLGDSGFLNTGGRYNPNVDSWTATSTTNAPSARINHTAVWSGSQMVVWGGSSSGALNTGGRYCAPFTGSQLGNISTRASVQTGDNVVIGGFIVQGAQTKRVIIRAIGPELSAPPYNIANALANPTLELHNGTGALIASNDNWRTTIIGGIITMNQVRDITNSGYAPGDGRESAIIADLAPGNYTAIVRGVNNTTGVGLVEVYDLSGDASSILGNISTRSFVQTGDNVMIGGFIVQGTGAKRVIIRAIGPELSQFGVPDPLANPRLELRNAAGALIGSNDDWQQTIIGGVITHSQVADIQNSGHAPTEPSESAIIAELPPGNYTAIVRGVNDTTGVALVEVYDLDR